MKDDYICFLHLYNYMSNQEDMMIKMSMALLLYPHTDIITAMILILIAANYHYPVHMRRGKVIGLSV